MINRSPKRVLYISYDGILEPLGQSQVLAYLEKLCRVHLVHLISFEKERPLGSEFEWQTVMTRLKLAGVIWHPLRYHKKPLVIATAWDITRGTAIGLWLVVRYRLSIVHARSYVPSVIALLVKRVTGARYIFDMRGFWADERVDGGLWPSNSLLYRIAKWFETRFLISADHVVTLTHASLVPLLTMHPQLAPSRISVIPTCVDLERFTPVRGKRIGEGFTLGYVGSVGTWYLFEEMLEVFKALQGRRRNARLLLVNRNAHAEMESAVARLDIDPSRVDLVFADHSDVPNLISRMDAGLMLIKPCFSKLASAPTKLAEYLGCGVPCFGNVGVGDVEATLETNRVGVTIRSFDQSEIDEAVERMLILLDDPQVSLRCRATAEKLFSLDDGARKYAEIYASLALE